MLHIYCPICHGRLVLEPGQTEAVCENCLNVVPIPRGYTEEESAFNYAMEARIRRDFAAAEAAYTDILKRKPDSAAALWGRALSRYGIEYQPTSDQQYRLVCHQAKLSDFSGDKDVKAAIRASQGAELEGYLQEAKRISSLQAAVSRYAAVTAPYDVIIACGSSQSRTWAEKIRTILNAAGCRTFCPAVELASTPEQEREPMLYRAFSTAHTLVLTAVGKEAFSQELCFDAERFLYRKAELERKAAGQIPQTIVAFEGLDEYADIPDSIFDGADERLSLADPDFAKTISDMVTGKGEDYRSALRQEASGHENFQYSNLISSARQALEGEDFDAAIQLYEQILNYNPRESQAYWGLLLAEYECRNEDELIEFGEEISSESNYKNALEFATERERQTYRAVEAKASAEAERARNQELEEKRLEQEQEAKRADKEKEVAEAKQKKQEAERRETGRGRQRMLAFAVILVILAVAGVNLYQRYAATTGVLVKQYKEARSLYNAGNYADAADAFEKLGDYKDSEDMYQQAKSRYATEKYHQALNAGEEISGRAGAVSTLKAVEAYIPEAKTTLDQWLEEGEEYYDNNGGDYTAFQMLAGFGTESQAYVEVWRAALAEGLIAASQDYDAAAILQEDGTLQYTGCDGLSFEEGAARSVSISFFGDSAAVVRADGTVYVTGAVADLADVSGWSNVSSVQVTSETVIGLTKDGILLSSRDGVLASDIRQFDFNGDQVIAARLDGSVYCSDSEVEAALGDWSNVACIVMDGSTLEDARVLAATEDNGLLQFGCDFGDHSEKDVVAPVRSGTGDLSYITFDSKFFLIAFGDPVDITVTKGGDLNGIVYGTDTQDIELRKFIRDTDPVGIPNLSE